jgi:hypothetical protein
MFLQSKPAGFSLTAHTWRMFNEEKTIILTCLFSSFACSPVINIIKRDFKILAFILGPNIIISVVI